MADEKPDKPIRRSGQAELKQPPSSPLGASKKKGDSGSSGLWKVSSLGFEFISHVAAGGLLGWLADEFLFDSYPRGLIIGVVAGLIVGLTTLIRSALKYSRESSRGST